MTADRSINPIQQKIERQEPEVESEVIYHEIEEKLSYINISEKRIKLNDDDEGDKQTRKLRKKEENLPVKNNRLKSKMKHFQEFDFN